MRKILLAATLGLLGNAALAQNTSNNHETLEGNGKVVTRDVAVQSFNSLKASGVYELKLTQGATEAVRIEADENLQNLFTVKNEGGNLVIDMKKIENKNLKTKNKMRVYVTFKNLKSLDLSTVGNVTADNALSFDDLDLKTKSVGTIDLDLNANKLNLENKSVGEITLRGKAENAVFKNNGVGSLNAGNFVVQTLDIDNNGVGGAEVNAAKSIKVKDSFLGKVKNKGAAPMRKKNTVVI